MAAFEEMDSQLIKLSYIVVYLSESASRVTAGPNAQPYLPLHRNPAIDVIQKSMSPQRSLFPVLYDIANSVFLPMRVFGEHLVAEGWSGDGGGIQRFVFTDSGSSCAPWIMHELLEDIKLLLKGTDFMKIGRLYILHLYST